MLYAHTLSFLGRMFFFAVGLCVMKFQRSDIPREVRCLR
jgi:hypothetical protein